LRSDIARLYLDVTLVDRHVGRVSEDNAHVVGRRLMSADCHCQWRPCGCELFHRG